MESFAIHGDLETIEEAIKIFTSKGLKHMYKNLDRGTEEFLIIDRFDVYRCSGSFGFSDDRVFECSLPTLNETIETVCKQLGI